MIQRSGDFDTQYMNCCEASLPVLVQDTQTRTDSQDLHSSHTGPRHSNRNGGTSAAYLNPLRGPLHGGTSAAYLNPLGGPLQGSITVPGQTTVVKISELIFSCNLMIISLAKVPVLLNVLNIWMALQQINYQVRDYRYMTFISFANIWKILFVL